MFPSCRKSSPPVFAIFGALLILGSCSNGYKVDVPAMVPTVEAAKPPNPMAGNVALGPVSGHGTIHLLGTAEVSAGEFRSALEIALSRSGYLSGAPEAALYALEAFLVETVQRDAGPTFHVDAFVRYKVTDASNKVLLQEIVSSETLATTGEVAAGGSAYMERAIRSNISKLLQRLAELETELSAGQG